MRAPSFSRQIWPIPVIYGLFGVVWVLMGDFILASINLDPEHIQAIQSIKGVLFVVLSTLLVGGLVYLQALRTTHYNEALQQRDERFRLALGSLREAAYDYDIAREVLHWSHGLQQLGGGLESGQITSLQQFRELVHPQDLPQLQTAYENVLNGTSRNYRETYRLRTANGNYMWVEARALIMRNAQGRPERMVGVIRDVTERQVFEMDLIASNRALTALSEGNREIMLSMDATQVLERICQSLVNKAGYSMAWAGKVEEGGLTIASLVGRQMSDLADEPLTLEPQNPPLISPATLAVNELRPVYCAVDATAQISELWRQRACAQGFSACLALPLFLQGHDGNERRAYGVLVIYLSNGDVFDERERVLLETLARDMDLALNILINHRQGAVAQLNNSRAEARFDNLFEQTMMALAATLERRDPFSAGHESRMAEMAVQLAERLGLQGDALRGIKIGALLHDIGQICVSTEILSKPGVLSPAENQLMRQHPQWGHDIVAKIDFPWPVKRMILEHHERMDGSGYPHGLKGNEICWEARLLAVVDVAASITSARSHRPAHTLAEALAVLSEPGKFDPQIVAAFIQMVRDGELKLAG